MTENLHFIILQRHLSALMIENRTRSRQPCPNVMVRNEPCQSSENFPKHISIFLYMFQRRWSTTDYICGGPRRGQTTRSVIKKKNERKWRCVFIKEYIFIVFQIYRPFYGPPAENPYFRECFPSSIICIIVFKVLAI